MSEHSVCRKKQWNFAWETLDHIISWGKTFTHIGIILTVQKAVKLSEMGV